MAKGLMGEDLPDFEKKLDRIKWFLCHGNTYKALDNLESLDFELDLFSEDNKHKKNKLARVVSEFHTYIHLNSPFIPNYGERYRHGEAVSSAVAESTVNEMVSRRMAKKQQRRWTKKEHILFFMSGQKPLIMNSKTLSNAGIQK